MPDFQSYAYLQQSPLTSLVLSSSINHEQLNISCVIIFCICKDSTVLSIIFQICLSIFHTNIYLHTIGLHKFKILFKLIWKLDCLIIFIDSKLLDLTVVESIQKLLKIR